MAGKFVHDIDPVLADFGVLYLWHYGLFYSLGFVGIFLWFRSQRTTLRFSLAEVYDLSIIASISILIGGRLMAVLFYEWAYYSKNLHQILFYWIGGMGTHGFLIGVVIGAWVFCRLRRKSLLVTLDMLVIPGAFILGFGRLANFIDGQIVGSVTDVWWAVKFPDADGFRHPYVLYDGIKNFLLVIPLLLIRTTHPPKGVLTAHFLIWYGFFRFLLDFLRDYRADLLGLPSGQWFNISMVLIGAAMLLWTYKNKAAVSARAITDSTINSKTDASSSGLVWRRIVFVLILLFSLVISSDRTQDIPQAYAKRHPGLKHSALYPPISMELLR